jgi:hypothetical protein
MKRFESIGWLLCIAIFLFAAFGDLAAAQRNHPEKYYQEKWCNAQGGQVEYVLGDGTRVDCLTDTHAIEFDFGNKWAEAIGQSLHYASLTDKIPGIVLIMETDKELKYFTRLLGVITYHTLPIETWGIFGEPDDQGSQSD